MVLLLVLCLMGQATYYAQACHLDFFQQKRNLTDGSKTSLKCVPCTVCLPGFGVKIDCLEKSDTVCRKCAKGEFSSREWDKRVCVKCTKCAAFSRITQKPCNSLNDSICGDCLPGFVPGEWDECISQDQESEFKADSEQDEWSQMAKNIHEVKSYMKREISQNVVILAISLSAVSLLIVVGISIFLVKKQNMFNCSCTHKVLADEEVLITQESLNGHGPFSQQDCI